MSKNILFYAANKTILRENNIDDTIEKKWIKLIKPLSL